MSKQTAVEWLMEQINNKPLVSGWSDSQLTISISKDIIEQAKAMERDQIVKAWEYGCMTNYGDAQTYYNETYKGGEQ